MSTPNCVKHGLCHCETQSLEEAGWWEAQEQYDPCQLTSTNYYLKEQQIREQLITPLKVQKVEPCGVSRSFEEDQVQTAEAEARGLKGHDVNSEGSQLWSGASVGKVQALEDCVYHPDKIGRTTL